MVNYGNSMIYKLACKDTNITDIYVGSTTNFYRRKSEHKNTCNNINLKSYNNYKYQFIRNNGDFENWDMILIKNVNVSSKRELEKIEREYIDELKPTLNSIKSYTSTEERKEHKKEYRKDHYEKNKEHRKEYEKEYREKNKDKLKEYRDINIDRINQKQKQWRDNNKEYQKEYRDNNKEKINQKINCPICNSLILKRNISRHQRSKKCISCK